VAGRVAHATRDSSYAGQSLRRTGLKSAQILGPLPVQAQGMKELVVDRFDDLPPPANQRRNAFGHGVLLFRLGGHGPTGGKRRCAPFRCGEEMRSYRSVSSVGPGCRPGVKTMERLPNGAAGHADPSTTKLYDRRGYNPEKSASFFANY
jgi:hypothetical protein